MKNQSDLLNKAFNKASILEDLINNRINEFNTDLPEKHAFVLYHLLASDIKEKIYEIQNQILINRKTDDNE